ncbi:MAG: hypothetical protein JXA46_13090 [Dehalococcoidales bacterium]|nr:hypothetical protein [Dehalococcoidales bacterium]
MADSSLEKYIKYDIQSQKAQEVHPQVKGPVLAMMSNENFGGHDFTMTWWPISQPFEMVSETHYHDFDQYLMFFGGDVKNMMELGGEVELSLGEQDGPLEKLVITKPAIVYVRAGMRHGPLNFKKVNDPAKPILYNDLTFTVDRYERKK